MGRQWRVRGRRSLVAGQRGRRCNVELHPNALRLGAGDDVEVHLVGAQQGCLVAELRTIEGRRIV